MLLFLCDDETNLGVDRYQTLSYESYAALLSLSRSTIHVIAVNPIAVSLI